MISILGNLARACCGMALATAMMVLPAGHANAHAHLARAVPAGNARLSAAPASLSLTFSESISLRFSDIAVTGPDNNPVKLGDRAFGANDHSTLVVPVGEPLKAGKYTVVWHALAADGHKSTGSYAFTVEP